LSILTISTSKYRVAGKKEKEEKHQPHLILQENK
jgi:hypothetical protein